MSKHKPIPASEVSDWLTQHHPDLYQETDRGWVWLVADLRGEHNRATRESLKAFGFAYKFKGTHPLPSGAGGNWSHSCDRPISFKRRGNPTPQNKNEPAQRADPLATYNRLSDSELQRLASAF